MDGAHAIFLPYVIQYNRTECEGRYADIARVLKLEGNTDAELTDSLIAKINEFNVALNIPSSMKEYGVTEEDFLANVKHIAHNAVLDACNWILIQEQLMMKGWKNYFHAHSMEIKLTFNRK